MKYYIIAGEASGDLHGSNLMRELQIQDKNAYFRFFGGDLMQGVGGDLVKHYRDLAFMGFVKVILNLRTIKKIIGFCKNDIIQFQPDVLVLIDYPGFNLRIAEFAKQNNFKVFYYISPKIWAWKESRVKKIKAFVDEMFTIFPFETGFYKKHNFKVHYVGNPLLDSISAFRKNAVSGKEFFQNNGLNKKPIVALLAGSRIQEVKRVLPAMLESLKGNSDFQFVLSGMTTIPAEVYKKIIGDAKIPVVYNQTYNLLNNAHAALVTSGTAALETALFNVPQVVLYKAEGGWLVDILFRNFLLKTRYVSLPNIIAGKEIIKELLQMQMTVKNIKKEIKRLFYDKTYRENIKSDYSKMSELLGDPGSSEKAAKIMVELLDS